jgi:multisubunit Na+/H+ antiporter MnhE subunit
LDTLIFLLLLATWWVVLRTGERKRLLVGFAVSLVAVLLLFNHHVTSSLNLEF